jgi:hypothetical protein
VRQAFSAARRTNPCSGPALAGTKPKPATLPVLRSDGSTVLSWATGLPLFATAGFQRRSNPAFSAGAAMPPSTVDGSRRRQRTCVVLDRRGQRWPDGGDTRPVLELAGDAGDGPFNPSRVVRGDCCLRDGDDRGGSVPDRRVMRRPGVPSARPRVCLSVAQSGRIRSPTDVSGCGSAPSPRGFRSSTSDSICRAAA